LPAHDQKGLVLKRHPRAFALACLLALSALFLVACGGGDDDGGGGEEDTIVNVITEAAVEEKPEHCTELLTLQFNEQTQKVSGKESIAQCEEEAGSDEGSGTDSVEVTNIQIEDGGAEAEVAFTGGDFDGQTMTIALVEEGGQWKLDEIVGFAEFDREALLDNLSTSLDESTEGAEEKAEAECIVEGVEELDDEGLEGLFLEDNFDTLAEIAEAC
jgi:Domain of unknown function (DUF4878)